MTLEMQIVAAVVLDLVAGDPRYLPHPVRAMGWAAQGLEAPLRRKLPPRAAGIIATLVVVGLAGGTAYGALAAARWVHPRAAEALGVVLIYTSIAAHDLARHSHRVYRALRAGDLPAARQAVGRIVGRDTDRLDEAGVVRAAVESVAENAVDAVTAPLFYAVLFGPVGAVVYRAINTLDSTFGYKDERYAKFGWASARLDDVANYIPARLTAPLMSLAAGILCGSGAASLRVLWRDGRNHSSPNAGLSEAAVAGALGLQLGGVSFYGGEPVAKPTLGDASRQPQPQDIVRANGLMFAATALFLVACLAARMAALAAWSTWRG